MPADREYATSGGRKPESCYTHVEKILEQFVLLGGHTYWQLGDCARSRPQSAAARSAPRGWTRAQIYRICETICLAGDAYIPTPMKIRMIETTVRGSPASSYNGLSGPNHSSAPRTSLALVEKFGPCCAGVAAVLLIAVLFLGALFSPDSRGSSSPDPGNGFSGWGCPPGKTFHWYVSDGQLMADVRTALAIVRYVLSPELEPRIPPVVPQHAPFLSATTNSGTNIPKV
jgi:hypothetical protein